MFHFANIKIMCHEYIFYFLIRISKHTLVNSVRGLTPGQRYPLLVAHHAQPEAQVVDEHVEPLVLVI